MAKGKASSKMAPGGGKGRHLLVIIATPMGRGKPSMELKKAKGSKGRQK